MQQTMRGGIILSFTDELDTLFVEACNEAIQNFRQTDRVYDQAVKRRAELSPVIAMLAEYEGDIHLTDEQRKSVVEYIALLNEPRELEVLVACYTHGMQDCIMLMRRLDVLKDK